MFRNRKFILILTVMLCAFLCFDASAASARTLAEINNSISKKQAELKKQKAKSEDYAKMIKDIESQIKTRQKDIDELDDAISDAEADLARLKTELKKAEKKVETQQENLNARLRGMYKNGTVGFIDVLLQSSDFSEFLDNLSLVQMVFESDKEVLEELETAHDTIKKKTTEIQKLNNDLKESYNIANDAKAKLAAQQKDLDSKKDALDGEMALTQKEIDKMEAEAQRLTATINNAQNPSAPPQYTGGKMCWPAPSYTRISCYFGWRTHPITGKKNYHGGTDLAAPGGSPILAGESGTVIIAQYHYSYGNYVVIDHGGGLATLYAHSSKLLVKKGDKVSRGQKIALVGTTGSSTGNHLHFEVRKNGVRVNGLPYIQ